MVAASVILKCRKNIAARSAAALPQARKHGEFVAANTAASLPQSLAASGCVRSTPPAADLRTATRTTSNRLAGEGNTAPGATTESRAA